jgi:hypothetical protein
VDGEHRALQHIGALLRKQAGKLGFLAGFQNENAIAIQSVSHVPAATILTPIDFDLFIMILPAGLAQGRRG